MSEKRITEWAETTVLGEGAKNESLRGPLQQLHWVLPRAPGSKNTFRFLLN